jgi:7-carboxy-7-deazaguanine synthase
MSAGGALQIYEIYASLQGESTWAGRPTVFVRTAGCPVRCTYCDTAYAFTGGHRMAVDEIVAAVAGHGIPRVCLTGGEPLAQPGARALVASLVESGYHVSVETSGVRPIAGLARPCKVVLDLKTPGSGVLDAWLPETIGDLQAGDELKVVVTSAEDWAWLLGWLDGPGQQLPAGVEVSVSPMQGVIEAADLAAWILAAGRDLRLNLQLHKIIWPQALQGV